MGREKSDLHFMGYILCPLKVEAFLRLCDGEAEAAQLLKTSRSAIKRAKKYGLLSVDEYLLLDVHAQRLLAEIQYMLSEEHER